MGLDKDWLSSWLAYFYGCFNNVDLFLLKLPGGVVSTMDVSACYFGFHDGSWV